jgi:hypothetical protein
VSRVLAAALLALALTAAIAQPLVIQSPEGRVSLLELYTSEGCSSCPPADRWLSTLRDDPRLWRLVVPVAFHVDYWDYLGWRDRFADPAHAERQRTLAGQGLLSIVYTPGLVLDGKEWRAWHRWRRLQLEAPRPRSGRLRLEIERNTVRASFRPADPPRSALELHIALLGFGLETAVEAGENRGRALAHDFVALGHEVLPMHLQNGEWRAIARLADPGQGPARLATAAWISRDGDERPLQATGGWLP